MYVHPPVGGTDLLVANKICFEIVAGHHAHPDVHMIDVIIHILLYVCSIIFALVLI